MWYNHGICAVLNCIYDPAVTYLRIPLGHRLCLLVEGDILLMHASGADAEKTSTAFCCCALHDVFYEVYLASTAENEFSDTCLRLYKSASMSLINSYC